MSTLQVLDIVIVLTFIQHSPDVHNNTPILDIISLGDEARSISSLELLESSNTALILDLENCSRQSAVWRSVYQGHRRLTQSLLARTTDQSGARVEPVSRRTSSSYLQSSIRSLVPALLAPLLSDSPCSANLHVSSARRRPAGLTFSSERSDHVARHHVAPHVDNGELLGGHVPDLVSSLISSQTEHSCAGDSAVVDTNSLLPLMFGQLTAGLRQLAARTILSTILFTCRPEEASAKLDKVCESQGFMLTQLYVKPSLSKPKKANEASMSYEYEIELGNEMELSFGGGNLGESDDLTSDNLEITISDNSSSNSPVSDALIGSGAASELMETIAKLDRELETIKTECVLDSLDRDLANWETELVATLDRIQTYHAELGSLDTVQQARRRSQELMEEMRLQRRLLDSSSKEIEELENSIASIDITALSPERGEDGTRRMLDDNWSLGSARFLAAEEEDPDGAASLVLGTGDVDREEEDDSPGTSLAIREYRETLVQTLTVAASYSREADEETDEPAPSAGGRRRIPFLRQDFPRTTPLPPLVESDVSNSDSEPESDDSSDTDTWGGTFSLRHTRPTDTSSQADITEANLVSRLSPRTLFALTDHLGLPHSLRPVFSVEAARLQLCLALHHHRSINCDRNCEGEESDTEDSETEDWLNTDSDTDDSLDEADIAPNLTDSDHSRSYEDDDQSSESSLSDFSQRSWYGSLSQITEGRQLTPLSTPPALTHSEDSEEEPQAWLEDREDLRRVRHFLETGPGPDFTHSTDSESVSD